MARYDSSARYDTEATYDSVTTAPEPEAPFSTSSSGLPPPTLTEVLARASVPAVARLVALWQDGSVRRSFGVNEAGAIIVDGTVNAELRRDVRRSASLNLTNADGSLVPRSPGDLLAIGARCRLERGAVIGEQPTYTALLNGFVTGCEPDMNGYLGLVVESHMSALAQDTGEAFMLPRGTFLLDALYMLWNPVLPWVQWAVSAAAEEKALGADIPVLTSDSRLDVGLKLARDLGCVAYDDREGRIVVRVRPDPTTQATTRVMTLPIALRRSLGSQPFNAQPVESTPTEGKPFFVMAQVDDPASPYHRDRIGLRTAPTITSDSIPDAPTALDMAARVLAARALRQDTLAVTNLPQHIDLDEGDIVERIDPLSGTDGRYLIESITYPVGMGTVETSESSVVPLYLTENVS